MNFRNYRWGEIAVSAAGPLSNLALAVVFAYLLRLGGANVGFMKLAFFGVNSISFWRCSTWCPSPRLDGSHILEILLPRDLARLYAYLEPVGFILILILILFYAGILSALLMPLYRAIALFILP